MITAHQCAATKARCGSEARPSRPHARPLDRVTMELSPYQSNTTNVY